VDFKDFDLIVADPGTLGGKPRVRGTRFSVEFILELLASGASRDDIARGWPDLTPEAVEQAVRFAAASLANDVYVAVRTAS
jgi:uncharacterized protein (DUF433 family)